jgi:hypothetical protein
MLMRSTGLGKTELVAEIKDVKPQGDHLIMYVDTTEPVKWKIRCTLTLKDAKTLIAVSLKFSIFAFVSNIPKWFKEPAHPGDF